MEKEKTSQADVEALQLEQVGCFEGTEGRTLNFDVGYVDRALNSFSCNIPSCLFSTALIHPPAHALICPGTQQMIVLYQYSVAGTVLASKSIQQ